MSKCVSCEQEIPENEYSCNENFMLCQSCESDDQAEPIAWVHHFLDNDDESSLRIGNYFDETDGEFTTMYKKTDGWRGHYEVEAKNYTKVHDDCSLAYSEDSKNLEQFDDFLKKIARKYKIGIVRVCTRTSNLFSLGVDYYVHNSHLDKFNKQLDKINNVKNNLRDIHEFNRTAISGE